MRLSLVFATPMETEADGRGLERLHADFRVVRAGVNDDSVLFLDSRERLSSRDAVDRLIQQACRIAQAAGFRLTGARTTAAREIRRADAAIAAQRVARARADREADRRRAAEARAALRTLRRSPPTVDELTEVLRRHWAEVIADQPHNPMTDGRFSRVRNVHCRRRDGFFRCRVGILGTSTRGPEYVQLELDFRRLDDGSVVFRPTPIIITGRRPPGNRATS